MAGIPWIHQNFVFKTVKPKWLRNILEVIGDSMTVVWELKKTSKSKETSGFVRGFLTDDLFFWAAADCSIYTCHQMTSVDRILNTSVIM